MSKPLSSSAVETIVHRFTEIAVKKGLEDWETQIEFASSIGEGRVSVARSAEEVDAFWSREAYLEVTTEVQRSAEGALRWFFSMESAWPIVREALCMPPSAELGEDGILTDAQLDAFKEMMNLLCGSANAVYQQFGMQLSQSVDSLSVVQREPGAPENIRGLVITMPYSIDGTESREIIQVLAAPVAIAIAEAVHSNGAAA